MERLTIEYCGNYVPKELCSIDKQGGADDCELCYENCKAMEEGNEDCSGCAINKCFDKLGKYEDLEEKGRLLKLPCAVGDTEGITNTGLFDKNGTPINVGDKTRLVLDDGEVREFDVCFKTVNRTIKTLTGFEPETMEVSITGVFFCWEGNDLLPCIDENRVSDVSKMEVVKHISGKEAVSRLFD